MTGGEDKEGHVVTFKTWIRNTNNTDIIFCMQGKHHHEITGRGRTKRGKKTTNSKISF